MAAAKAQRDSIQLMIVLIDVHAVVLIVCALTVTCVSNKHKFSDDI